MDVIADTAVTCEPDFRQIRNSSNAKGTHAFSSKYDWQSSTDQHTGCEPGCPTAEIGSETRRQTRNPCHRGVAFGSDGGFIPPRAVRLPIRSDMENFEHSAVGD